MLGPLLGALLGLAGGSAQAATLRVRAGEDLQAALDAAAPGDVVEDKQDRNKLDAYWTLYECLLTTTKLIAPFTPFMAETLWQNLAVAGAGSSAANSAVGGSVSESVHLCDYPIALCRRGGTVS